MELNSQLIEAMAQLERETALQLVQAMMDQKYTYLSVQQCLNKGISLVGSKFEIGEYFIADLIVASIIYRDALQLLNPIIPGARILPIGRVVIGVVEGDIHDLGKDIMVSLLRAERFEVIDLGIDVKPSRFAYAARTYRPDVLLLSGVLRLAMTPMRRTIELLENEGLREDLSVLVGGLCTNEELCRYVGADAWAYDTNVTLNFCKQVIGAKNGQKK